MIKHETLENGLIRTYSTKGKMIIQKETGIEYSEAIDVPNTFTYKESTNDIEVIENETIPNDSTVL